ncbi:hypothetical protein [Sphingobacterium siyangense]|uniref:hypothetical protein n=1 Tax=Sphingobacterium siyangense TaxID=459529 RepID=UPI0030194362
MLPYFGRCLPYFGQEMQYFGHNYHFSDIVAIFRTMLQDFGKSYMSWQELLVEATLLYANNQA